MLRTQESGKPSDRKNPDKALPISAESEVKTSTMEDTESLSLRKLSFLLEDNNENIINSLKNNEFVKSIEIARNGRINLRIDYFDDNAVSNVLSTVLSCGGVIKSISTEEPSLEDVFIKSTSEVNENDRA